MNETHQKQQIERLQTERVFPVDDAPLFVARHCLDGQMASGTHDHDFGEIVLISGGKGRHLSIYGERDLSSGDCLILMPGTWHSYRDCEALEVHNCCFRPALLHRDLAALSHDMALFAILETSGGAGRGPVELQLQPSNVEEMLNCLAALRCLQNEASPTAHVAQIGHFLLLLSQLSGALKPEERRVWEQTAHWPSVIRTAARRMDENLAHSWTLLELASQAHLAPEYFVRLFKAHTGQPPLTYLARRRAERAATLLLATPKSISEIAVEVGWDEPNYFARRFRQHLGISASEYRAQGKLPHRTRH
jgi:AraC family L-rhamnose operon transcriptional activator RhaR